MTRRLYAIFLLVIISLIAVLNFYAYKYHWYWQYWWFDIIMHTLGGIWVPSTALWIRYFRNPQSEKVVIQKRFIFLYSLAAISIIGVGWELFEFSMDKFIIFKIHDAVNTASDLFFDGVGSILGAVLFLAVYRRYTKE